ncbi:hypothetical protein BU15DRAFT_82056 [Melanogaster broomeanus]|nr:hypothetical protein BU15DRAFT_82056 [Melanogaster broomeanus]
MSARPSFPSVPETSSPLQAPTLGSRRFSENRFYALTSRTPPSPIPGPLPAEGFQFGDPSSASPSNASPVPTDSESPPGRMQSPDVAALHRWSFPRSRETDQDTEESGSYYGLSRFGSVASISGSESSAMYSDVSSCVAVDHMAYDPNVRRGSCASGSGLETRMSVLNMSTRSSQGSLNNEGHLNALATRSYSHRDGVARQELPSEVTGGFTSPPSTASPGGSPHVRHVKEPGPSGLRRETGYEYGPLVEVPGSEIAAARRGSIYAQESIPHIYVQNSLEAQGPYTPSSDAGPSPAQSTHHFHPGSGQSQPQHHHSHTGNFIPHPQPGFSQASEASFGSGSGLPQPEPPYQQQDPSNELQYPTEVVFQGAPNTMGMGHADASGYAPPANQYDYAPGHAQVPYRSFN